ARHLRTPVRPALRRRQPVGGRHHCSRPHPRSADPGPRIRRAQSAPCRIQNRSAANVMIRPSGLFLLGIALIPLAHLLFAKTSLGSRTENGMALACFACCLFLFSLPFSLIADFSRRRKQPWTNP